jgi:hypothetical protein
MRFGVENTSARWLFSKKSAFTKRYFNGLLKKFRACLLEAVAR